MTMSDCMGGRRERRKAQTRAEVRRTAQRLFAEHGFDAVTIADVEHCVRGPAGTLLVQQR
jgi:AcrR family transcriptional regulator